MFILNPDKYLIPDFRISPFKSSDIHVNNRFPDSDAIDNYFSARFKDRSFIYTYNGRKALSIALKHYDLQPDDCVTIFTTSGNFYISSCVTREIEKFCKWSRDLLPETKVILVNHEFGYPYRETEKLKEINLPVIEDCAGSFFSQDKEDTIGQTGDFIIYSFPKMFPIQVGGLLISNFDDIKTSSGDLNSEMLRYIKNVLSAYISVKDQIIEQRIANYKALSQRFESLGLHERFMPEEGIVPGVFMFRTGNYKFDLPELKNHFWANGIQSSVFYGEETFFIPVHQALTGFDLDYFYEVMNSFIQKQ